MKLTEHIEIELKVAPEVAAPVICDLGAIEALHPLLRSVTLEREEDGLRIWRCHDRILGVPLTYFPEQRLDEDGLGYVSRVDRGGLQLENRWRLEPTVNGTLLKETLHFEGAALVVLFSRRVAMRAHRKLFEALQRHFNSLRMPS